MNDIMNRIEDMYELTPLQEGMLFHNLLNEQGGEYLEQCLIDINSNMLTMEDIIFSIRLTVRKHAVLRTKILHKALEKPIQVIIKDLEPEIKKYIINDSKEIFDVINNDSKRGFNLEEDTLIRISIIQQGMCVKLLWTMHHIITDGWSLSLIHI